MNKLALVLVFALVALSTQVTLKSKDLEHLKMGTSAESKLKSLRGTPFGNMVSQLVSLHMKVGGPIDELREAIHALVDDIDEKEQTTQANFDVETVRHNNAVLDWTNKVAVERGTWEDSNGLLNNIYYPRRDELAHEIESLEASIAQNKATWTSENEERTKEFNLFVLQSGETKDAIGAIAEAIALVQQLKNTEAPSLVQIKKVKASLDKLKVAVRKMKTYGPMIAALMQLAQNFSDQAAVDKVLQLLNDMEANATGFLQELVDAEDTSAQEWVGRSAELKQALADYEDYLSTAEENQVENDASVAFQENRNAEAKAAWDEFQANLDLENSTYDNETATFQDLMVEFSNERNTVISAIAICEAAASQIRSSTIEEWNQ